MYIYKCIGYIIYNCMYISNKLMIYITLYIYIIKITFIYI